MKPRIPELGHLEGRLRGRGKNIVKHNDQTVGESGERENIKSPGDCFWMRMFSEPLFVLDRRVHFEQWVNFARQAKNPLSSPRGVASAREKYIQTLIKVGENGKTSV